MVKFKEFSRPLSVFQVFLKANLIFKDFQRQSCIFKYFSSLCGPWFTYCLQQSQLLFVCFDSLHPSQQFFIHVRTSLPVMNQYRAADKVSCSKTQHSDSTGGEAQTSNPSILPTEPLHSATTKSGFLMSGPYYRHKILIDFHLN